MDPPVGLRYSPSVEHLEDDEAETIHALVETMRKISRETFDDGGRAIRSVHAKAHGLIQGELEVAADLPPVLAQGLFAAPGRHPVAMRFSTLPGDILDDAVSTPRGVAIKVMGVEGARLEGLEGAGTQDFVMVDGPTFSAKTAKAFLANLKLLAATTDTAAGAKKALSAVFRGVEHALEAAGGKSATVTTLGGQPATHILGDTFHTQVPFRYGDSIAKLSLAPVSAELKALTDAPIDLKGHPDALREAVAAFFAHDTAEWELRVQLCTDLHDMPVEDATALWPPEKSPHIPVARIVAKPQSSYDPDRARRMDEGLAFNVWNGLEAHRPLGSINRARKPAYPMSAGSRADHNGVSNAEPAGVEALAG